VRSLEALAGELVERLDAFAVPVGAGAGAGAVAGAGAGLVTVLNATGVIVHTNLGRAPWPAAAIEAGRAAAGEYLLLEMDRASGRRGARFRVAEEHLIALTGAEDALVTNNNAAALVLAVGLAGRAGGVVVSRGELLEIGGGVRIPEIVRRAGARLIEVGTTNRTRVADFAVPVEEGRAKLVLRVHPSNFRQEGFVEAPDAEALAELAHRHGALLVDDLGSGALLPTERFGLAHEPMPAERLAAGADLVTFSGDKLVGGPQAGLIVGRADLVAKLRGDPLARATRPDKVTLAALAATLGLYRAGLAVREIPVWRMIATRPDDLRARAKALAEALAEAQAEALAEAQAERLDGSAVGVCAVALASTVGGGSLPGEMLPSWGLALGGASAPGAGSTSRGASASGAGSTSCAGSASGVGPPSSGGSVDALLARLRHGDPAVIGRIEDGRVLLDLRTVDPAHDAALSRAIVAALASLAS
jgi:L-seryl-tRNA(Ser) seleniumtransferase